MTYSNLASIKAALGIINTDEDQMITEFMNSAQEIIENTCNRVFEAAADTTRLFDAIADVGVDADGQHLYLDTDLCQITTVLNGDGTTVTAGQYVTEPRNITPWYAIKLKDSTNISWVYNTTPENSISITGRWAYSITAPAGIVQAHKRLTMWFYRQKDNSGDIGTVILGGSGTVIVPSALPKDVTFLLDQYTRGVAK